MSTTWLATAVSKFLPYVPEADERDVRDDERLGYDGYSDMHRFQGEYAELLDNSDW